MKTLTVFFVCAAVGLAQPLPAAGDWIGTLEAGAAKLRIALHIAAHDGALSGTLDSLDQGALGIPMDSVSNEGDRLRFSINRLGASYEGTVSSARIEGTFTQNGVHLPLSFDRGKPQAPDRPQYPKPPLPYQSEEVTVASGDVRLAGTFTHPKTSGPFSALLLVTGSGAQDRDETVFNQKPFLVIADHLTRAGYAVLRLDDRGAGKSTGNFRTAGLKEFTDDALAAVAWLKARSDVDARRIGILGHSEGGAVGPLAAIRSSDVAFLIMLAGPAQPFEDLLVEQGAGLMRAAGAPEAIIDANSRLTREALAIIRREPDDTKAREQLQKLAEEWKSRQPNLAALLARQIPQLLTPEIRSLLAYPAGDTLSHLRCPVLAMFGGKDLQVPADSNLRAAAEAFTAGHVPDVTLVKLPGVNHLFQRATTGGVGEYAMSAETISPHALETITDWLKAKVQ